MNTKNIKSEHKNTYSNFFLKNNIIYSTPYIHSRTVGGEYCEMYSIKQHISLRLYIGVENTNSNCLEFGELQYFDPINNTFLIEKNFLGESYIETIIDYLRKTLPGSVGGKINILSECPIDIGLNFEQILSLLIGSLINHIIYGPLKSKITLKSTKEIYEIPIKHATYIAKKITGYKVSLDLLVSSISSSLPLIHKEQNGSSLRAYPFEKIKTIKTIKNSKLSSVDFAVTFSGISIKDNFIKPTDFKIGNEEKKEQTKVREGLNAIQKIINKQCYQEISRLFNSNLSETEIYESLRIIGRSRCLLYAFLRLSRSFVLSINHFITYHSLNQSRIAIIPHARNLSGGCYTIVTPFNRSRKVLTDIVNGPLKETSPSSFLVYASRLDGEEPDGLKIEQDLENGVLSEFVRKDLHVVTKSDGTSVFGSFHDLLENPDIDVLCDTDDMKIYVKGKKLTAKEITSQTAAVEVFERIIREGRIEINNRELERSSYTKDKNAMNGKILNPLKKVIKQRCQKELNIGTSGSLINFDITLGESTATIGLLSKISS